MHFHSNNFGLETTSIFIKEFIEDETHCGNIYTHSLLEIVAVEMKEKQCWFLTRQEVSPCKECIYNFLCPPVSNYEFVLKRNNLCLIK